MPAAGEKNEGKMFIYGENQNNNAARHVHSFKHRPAGGIPLFAEAQEILRGFLKVRFGGFVYESQIPVQPCMGVTPNPNQSGTALRSDNDMYSGTTLATWQTYCTSTK